MVYLAIGVLQVEDYRSIGVLAPGITLSRRSDVALLSMSIDVRYLFQILRNSVGQTAD